MYSFMQAELSDIRVVLQKVSGSQIARGVSSEMVVRLTEQYLQYREDCDILF